MRKFTSSMLLGAVLFCGLASGAAALDAEQVVSDRWQGFYAGVNAGFAKGDFAQGDNVGANSGDFTMNGGFAGVTVGYNHMIDRVLLGVETDFQIAGINGAFTRGTGWFCEGSNGCENSIDWFGTVRARMGASFDRYMPYVTGGLAVAHINSRDGLVGAQYTNFDDIDIGWTIGAGLETALSERTSLKIEVLHVDFGKLEAGSKAPPAGYYTENKFTFGRVGLNLAF